MAGRKMHVKFIRIFKKRTCSMILYKSALFFDAIILNIEFILTKHRNIHKKTINRIGWPYPDQSSLRTRMGPATLSG
jgi:hypothetical protein